MDFLAMQLCAFNKDPEADLIVGPRNVPPSVQKAESQLPLGSPAISALGTCTSRSICWRTEHMLVRFDLPCVQSPAGSASRPSPSLVRPFTIPVGSLFMQIVFAAA
jgi:hypothetical protein